MKFIFSIFAVGCFSGLFAQVDFPVRIQDFSDEFEGLIDLNDDDTLVVSQYDEYVPEYVIRIMDKKTNSEALKAYTNGFPDYLLNEENEAVPNIKELPYGSQSVLIYEDYNFDGIKDFAIMNGYNSCYGGPSFDIYLVDKSRKLQYSEGFSVLSNDYCGMFQIDDENQTIHTMTKSGCCWHEFSEFKVINNEPKVIKIIEEAYLSYNNFIEVTETDYKDGKEFSETKNYFSMEEMSSDIIFSFELEKSGKQLIIYQTEKILNYVLILEDEEIEFYFPQPYYDEQNQETVYENFTYDMDENTLSFKNADAEYEIYESPEKVGIKVKTKGKTYDLKGKKDTITGTLKDLRKPDWDNILYNNF